MATAIRQVDLAAGIGSIEGLDRYARCMLVFRWRGRVVGRAFVPVTGGRVDAGAVNDSLRASAGENALNEWLRDYVGHDERALLGDRPRSATVAVCTRERPRDLRQTLEAISRLEGTNFDVLVVDNAPESDTTRLVTADFPRIRYVCEPQRGLNAARNRALAEAAGEVVAFCDDDALPEPGWLNALVANFAEPRVMCATGLTLPLELETEAQEIFEAYSPFEKGFRRRVFEPQWMSPLAVGPVGAGANMAVRRALAARVGRFDERLDAGTPTRSGGDHEMFVRILSAGHQIVYDPAAVSWHRHRRTRQELLDTVHGYGVGVYAMWTGLLLERREIGALRLAWTWFRNEHLPQLLGRWPSSYGGSDPTVSRETIRELALTQMRGCLRGPRAWLAARRISPAGARS